MTASKRVLLQGSMAILVFFIASRVLGMLLFEPHNDEVLYVQYTRWLARSFSENMYASLDGRMFQDYKEPLQFWVASLTVSWFKSSLLGVRLWSVVMGFLGLLSTTLLARKVWGKSVAAVTAVLILTSGTLLYFDAIGVTEAFVYGLGMTYLYVLYEGLVCRRGRNRWALLVTAGLLLVLLLTTKRSGMLFLGAGFLMPILMNTKKRNGFGFTSLIAASAIFVHDLIIPDTYDTVAHAFGARSTHPVSHVLSLPLAEWWRKVSETLLPLLTLEFGILLWPLVVLVLVHVWTTYRKDRLHFVQYVLCVGLFLALSIGTTVFMVRPYERHYAVAFPLLALVVAIPLATLLKSPSLLVKRTTAMVFVGLLAWRAFAFTTPLLRYGQTNIALAETPGGWASGIGMTAMVERLRSFPPGVLIYDHQWGHPGTTIEVFQNFYPSLELTYASAEVLENTDVILDYARKKDIAVYGVFDRRTEGERPHIDRYLGDPNLCSKKSTIEKTYQGVTLEGTAIVLCEAEL